MHNTVTSVTSAGGGEGGEGAPAERYEVQLNSPKYGVVLHFEFAVLMCCISFSYLSSLKLPGFLVLAVLFSFPPLVKNNM